MAKYKIYPMHVGDLQRQKSNLLFMKYPGEKVLFPLICWYITDGERHIMVDTGETPPDGRWQPSYRTPEQNPAQVLKRMGVDPLSITEVIFTHLHWDHAGNNHLFPNAKFYVQKDEIRDAAAPELKIFAGSYDYEQIFKTRYNVVDGDCQILDGIRVIKTPGHSMGSQSVIIDTEKGEYLLAGDLIGMFECMDFEPWVANSLHINLLDYYNSFEKVRKTGAFILPGHDYKVFEHAVYPF